MGVSECNNNRTIIPAQEKRKLNNGQDALVICWLFFLQGGFARYCNIVFSRVHLIYSRLYDNSWFFA